MQHRLYFFFAAFLGRVGHFIGHIIVFALLGITLEGTLMWEHLSGPKWALYHVFSTMGGWGTLEGMLSYLLYYEHTFKSIFSRLLYYGGLRGA